MTVKKKSTLLPPLLHRRWVLRLLAQHTTAEVSELLLADDLPVPCSDVLIALKAQVPKNIRSKKGVDFLKERGIEFFFNGAPEAQRVLDLLRHPRAREITEAGLVIGVPDAALVQVLEKHGQFVVTEPAMKLYSSVFFDLSCALRSQLRLLVHERVELAVQRAAGAQGPAVRRAILADGRTVAASLPHSSIAWRAVLLSLGITPGKADLGKMLGEMEGVASTRAAQMLLRGGINDERRAEGYTRVLRNLREIQETVHSPGADLAAKMMRFRLQTDTKPMVSVSDLRARGEDVTVELEPHHQADEPFGQDDITSEAGAA